MGPKLLSWQPGETLYSIRAFPIGGFCKMESEDEESVSERSFGNKSVPKRMITILAGSAMNFVLAFVIFAMGALTGGFATATTTIGALIPNGPAEQSGMLIGDEITHINGSAVGNFEDVRVGITTSSGEFINIVFLRDGALHQLDVPVALSDDDNRRIIGIVPRVYAYLGAFQSEREGMERASFAESVRAGARNIRTFVQNTFTVLGELVTGRASMDSLMGPIGIVGVIDDNFQAAVAVAEEVPRSDVFAQLLWMNMMFAGMLSIAIGIFNLLPLPALDGGRFIFLALEGVRGKPIKPETEGTIHFVGFVLLMSLALYIAYRDVIRLMM